LKTVSKKPDPYTEVDDLKMTILQAMKLTKEFETVTHLYPIKKIGLLKFVFSQEVATSVA
jgi:hypothetical protein